jgi:hypothetical protein
MPKKLETMDIARHIWILEEWGLADWTLSTMIFIGAMAMAFLQKVHTRVNLKPFPVFPGKERGDQTRRNVIGFPEGSPIHLSYLSWLGNCSHRLFSQFLIGSLNLNFLMI